MNYSREEINLIILDSFEELTYKIKYELLNGFVSSYPFWKNFEASLIKTLTLGVYNRIREEFSNVNYRAEILKGYEDKGIECVTFFSEDYPELLKQISAPPMVLYCKGRRELLKENKFSVVGSRITPPYALTNCKKTAEQLCSHFAVVTGIADGADTAALEGALNGGKAICVLAHGFDYVYPAISKPILQRVFAEGLAVTEHIPTVAPKNYLFPVRNRIIAGLSQGLLVVSAGKKSGALISANYAYEYGRELFAFPYNINVTAGEGCNALIKKGAYLTENILDIAAVFGLDLKTRQRVQLTKEEKDLLAQIKSTGEAHIEQLASALGVMPYELFPSISSLEVKGLIVRLGGNRFAAV